MAETVVDIAAVALIALAFAGSALAALSANRAEEERSMALRPIPIETTKRRRR